INPAAFTNYSYAIRDAAELVKAPLIEVHLSNPLAREEFRHTSVISGVANGTIGGFGPNSYSLAMVALKALIS
ncbi:MAG: type II 3-dehydroquinate dehydratase, partial [Candidatus Planktophila sp.]